MRLKRMIRQLYTTLVIMFCLIVFVAASFGSSEDVSQLDASNLLRKVDDVRIPRQSFS